MPYTVHYTAPSGTDAEQHELGIRAAERAMTFVSLGGSNVYVTAESGKVYRAPSEMPQLLRDAESTDADRT